MADQNPKYQEKSAAISTLFHLEDGEPWFFIRARDIHSPAAVEFYAQLLEDSMRPADAEQVRQFAAQLALWQLENPQLVREPSSVK